MNKLNEDASIHGILVQLPLPKGIDEQAVTDTVDARKDVDGCVGPHGCRGRGPMHVWLTSNWVTH